jgi:hypothetical protein
MPLKYEQPVRLHLTFASIKNLKFDYMATGKGLFGSSLARKYWMALTGLFLCSFLVIHLVGNLPLMTGNAEAFNIYAQFMTTFPVIKAVSYLLYASILLHAVDGFVLARQNYAARPVKYATYNGAALLGPAIAGFLLSVVGAGWLFAANAVSYLAVIYAVSQMPAVLEASRTPSTLADALLGGVRYARGHALTGILLLTSAVLSLFGRSYQQVLPIYADDIWNISAQGYGIMLSAAGAGAMIGALGMASLPRITPNGRNLKIAGILFAVLLASFAWTTIWWIGVGLLVCIGIISTVATTIIATMLQLDVPGHLRGRVMSLHAITLIGVPSVGGLLVTSLTTLLGSGGDTRTINATGAPMALVIGAITVALLFVVVRIPLGDSAPQEQ